MDGVGTEEGDLPRAPGLKPSTSGGLGLVSSGHKELDILLGGGLALGSSTVVQVDRTTNFGETLVGYGAAEGLSSLHEVLLLVHDERLAERLVVALPYNRNLEQQQQQQGEAYESPAAFAPIVWHRGEEFVAPERTSRPLTSSNTFKSIGSAQYCCSYDLSRRLQPSILTDNPAHVVCFSEHGKDGLAETLQRYLKFVESFLASVVLRRAQRQSSGVAHILLPRIDCWLGAFCDEEGDDGGAAASRLLLAFTLQLKHLVRSSRAILVVTVLAEAAPPAFAPRLAFLLDTALSVESFAGREASIPYEFQEFTGFFVVDKTHHNGCLVPHAPGGTRLGLKRDRRKLHLEPLHLPPAESRAFGSAGTDAALEKKAGRLAGGMNDLAYSPAPSTETSLSTSPAPPPAPSPPQANAPPVPKALTLAEKLALSRPASAAGPGGAVSISSFQRRRDPPGPGVGSGVGCGGGGALDF